MRYFSRFAKQWFSPRSGTLAPMVGECPAARGWLDRRQFEPCLRRFCAAWPETPFVLLMVRLDHDYVLGDSLFGGRHGDDIVAVVRRRLTAVMNERTTVVELGRGRLALLIDGMARGTDALRLAQALAGRLARPIFVADDQVLTAVSIGIAMPEAGSAQRPSRLRRQAQRAQRRARGAGGGVRFADTAREARVTEQMHLVADLPLAVPHQQLELFYQPIWNLARRQVLGFEALLRWRHPERGLLMPKDFLDLAADRGLLPQMTWWALGRACRQLAEWQQRFDLAPELFVALNLDHLPVHHGDLLRRARRAWFKAGLLPGQLVLEVPLDQLMASDLGVSQMRRLGREGLALTLDHCTDDHCTDDYCTDAPEGGAMTARITALSASRLKIDRALIARLGAAATKERRAAREQVRALVERGQRCGLQVIAVGVENAAQAAALRDLGCDTAQGNHLGCDLAPSQVGVLLQRCAHVEVDRMSVAI